MLTLHGITLDIHRIADLCRRHGVTRAYLFGSILTPAFSDHSDIDLLIETDSANPPGIFTLGGLQMDLSDLLGRPVHLTFLDTVPVAERTRMLSHAKALDAA